jgi:prevent-host-death family protein
MSETIGVRELKARASEILRCVREEGASYTVTHRGQAIARLTPVQPGAVFDEEDLTPFGSVEEMTAGFDALAEEIARRIAPGAAVSAVDLVRAQRRDL